ncbi:hypothetical protein FSP39_000993 [Pinctada imbricata]|uniref:ATP-dependent DNA helicase n=1 Tax=Pinctada imbricata TaxID=66713 RepID=A0AA88Y991_PINIB|nr:hypothetical protein FSP39_000993 [Pinctada imbricata]
MFNFVSEYREELVQVKKELKEVEGLLEDLLHRQSSLLERKTEIEEILKKRNDENPQSLKKWNSSDFKWSKELEEKMKSQFGIDALRPMQLQTMNMTMSGKDCILIMPTGGGKSLCFQLPALLCKGITLVVSPLVSLMEDQVMALQNLDIDATMLNASSDKATVKLVHDSMTDKRATLKLLYVTPEKLAKSKRFMNKLEKMYEMGLFARLVIDEVHCCSQWGHDFRPDYKFLGIMKRQFPEVPILGLTATATTKVIEDVKKILSIPSCHLLKASFNRPNLYYEVKQKPSVFKESMDEIQKLIKSRFSCQSGIIYCFSRKESEEVASELQQRGIKAGCYHADLSAKERSRVHRMWLQDKIHVVVATVAFGMGIDKPNVRFVIHHSLSKSMENLYQESGRAGRDNQKSHCIVYYRLADVFRQSTMVFTEQTGLNNLYGIMTYCTDVARCRRSIIARHFGEVWDKTQCERMCDHCSSEGKKAGLVKNGTVTISMDFRRKSESLSKSHSDVKQSKSSSSALTKSLSSSSSSVTKNDLSKVQNGVKTKPKLCIVKKPFSEKIPDCEKPPSVKSVLSLTKRKRPILIDSDSSDDNLDFGDKFDSPPAVKKKFSDLSDYDTQTSSSSMLSHTSGKSENKAVIIDSNSDSE